MWINGVILIIINKILVMSVDVFSGIVGISFFVKFNIFIFIKKIKVVIVYVYFEVKEKLCKVIFLYDLLIGLNWFWKKYI